MTEVEPQGPVGGGGGGHERMCVCVPGHSPTSPQSSDWVRNTHRNCIAGYEQCEGNCVMQFIRCCIVVEPSLVHVSLSQKIEVAICGRGELVNFWMTHKFECRCGI